MPNNSILIYAQVTRKHQIHPVFFELVTKARQLKEKMKNMEINAFLIGDEKTCNGLTSEFNNYGIDTVYTIKSPDLRYYSSINYSLAAIDLIENIQPSIILLGATTQGRDLAPRIACSLHTGLTADCTDLDINDFGKLLATRPTFGGQLMATIMCKTNFQMATVRPNVFKSSKFSDNYMPEIVDYQVNVDFSKSNIELIDFIPKGEKALGDFTNSKIIVAAGKGIKNKQNFEKLKQFANKIGASIGATRGLVEKGIAPVEIQIGQTGKTVSPNIYIACGISGAIQHTVGMENSDYIIAINNDESAPIFEIADLGIVGDIFEILPELDKIIDL